MTQPNLDAIHPDAMGLRIYKHKADELIACEQVMFVRGRGAVLVTLLRASLSGGNIVIGEDSFPMDYFADVYSDPWTCVQTIGLDRISYGSLKTKWMRCKLDRSLA
jgi:hypothetical protein